MAQRKIKNPLSAMWSLLAICMPACNVDTPNAEQLRVRPGTANEMRSRDSRPLFRTEAIPTNADVYPYNHAASLAELPNGDLLLAWVAGSAEAAKDTRIVASRRVADSSQWSPAFTVADTPESGDANPVLFVDDSNRVWLFYVSLFGNTLCLSNAQVVTSIDDGATWSMPRQAFDGVCTLTRNKPIILPSGRWILPAYFQGVYQSRFYLSDDRGQSWLPTERLLTFPNNLQPAVVSCGEGRLLSLMRSADGAGFAWQGISEDEGETWRMTRRDDIPNPGSGLDMTRLTTGELVLAYNHSRTQRTPMSVAYSDDDGSNWSAPRSIQKGEPDFAYPCILQARDGTIHVVFSYRLQHIQHVEFNRDWLRRGS